jgi:hypothetical protein
MKNILLLSIFFISALCWTDGEIVKILSQIDNYVDSKNDEIKNNHDYEGDEEPELIVFFNSEKEIIGKSLKHEYFNERFSNFDGVLGIGTEGVVFKVDFQLFHDDRRSFPVALKIDFDDLTKSKAESIQNYVNLMVDPQDQSRQNPKEDIEVFDLSQHFKRMLNNDLPFKNDVPYLSMIYQAAIITLPGGEDDPESTKYVTVSATQLGSYKLLDDFLPDPDGSDAIKDSNSEIVAKMIIEMCYATLNMYEQSYVHPDLSDENILISEDAGNFTPLIIDFGKLISLEEFKKNAILLEKEMLQTLDEESENYLDGFHYLITDRQAAYDFKYTTIDPSSFLTPETQTKLSNPGEMYLVNIQYNMGTTQLVITISTFLKELIENDFINEKNGRIVELKKNIELRRKENKKKIYITDLELFQNLNNESGLKLNEFQSKNVYLNIFLTDNKTPSNSNDPNKKLKPNPSNDTPTSSNNSHKDNTDGGRLILV